MASGGFRMLDRATTLPWPGDTLASRGKATHRMFWKLGVFSEQRALHSMKVRWLSLHKRKRAVQISGRWLEVAA
jgi:hypothetical protein